MKHAEDKLYELWKQTTLNASTDEALYRYVSCVCSLDSVVKREFVVGHFLT
jgi:hypothetical protein